MQPSPKLSQQLCFSFYTINRLFHQFYKQALEPYDLTYTQYLVLVALWEKDHRQLQDLGKDLDLASNTLTPLLKRLEEKGLVLRTKPEKDKRQLFVHLTESGLALRKEIESQVLTCFRQLEGFTEEQADMLLANNKVLIQMLQDRLS
ncbi:MarR family winged helix-turn-helix transcriptional regulator [Streptococcus loxodontisalivarius]|uniref:HTH-type transcriptional regulator SarZ n=1 Tax=Streptococcus loxodontisalivarius TaxID=1349415 RepID=A0ABS2PRF1_9STRE|nr:MarR family transcriptional regulator [Streptococcus loxodontisalivarius]MBM7642456.1 DNA-binding MarR family transcriptional regulator [Streptococcus loxodontisalivarius]